MGVIIRDDDNDKYKQASYLYAYQVCFWPCFSGGKDGSASARRRVPSVSLAPRSTKHKRRFSRTEYPACFLKNAVRKRDTNSPTRGWSLSSNSESKILLSLRNNWPKPSRSDSGFRCIRAAFNGACGRKKKRQ